MKNKTLKIVQHILVIAVALFTFNGLSYALTSGDNGFLMLTFHSNYITDGYAWGLILMGFLCWLQCLFSLAAIILSIVSIFMKKESTTKTLSMLILIGGVAFTFLYMLQGIIETVISKNTYEYGDSFVTLAFIPFLLNIALMITYFILPSLAKNNGTDYNGYDNIEHNGSYENVPNTSFVGKENASGIEPNNLNSTIFYVKNYIPDERVMSFQNALKNSNVTDTSFINTVPLKNPTTVLLFSIFLGGLGVDRFYIGDTGMGVAKLLLSGLTFGIWPLVDIFICYKKAKELNYNNLINSIKRS